MGHHYQIPARVKPDRRPLKVSQFQIVKISRLFSTKLKNYYFIIAQGGGLKEIDAMNEDIKEEQKRWQPHEMVVIWEMSQHILEKEIELDPLKVKKDYRKLSAFDLLAKIKHDLPVSLRTKVEQNYLRKCDTGTIEQMASQIEDVEIDPIIIAQKHPTSGTRQSRSVQLFAYIKGLNGDKETITNIFIPQVKKGMIAPHPTISKRRCAKILSSNLKPQRMLTSWRGDLSCTKIETPCCKECLGNLKQGKSTYYLNTSRLRRQQEDQQEKSQIKPKKKQKNYQGERPKKAGLKLECPQLPIRQQNRREKPSTKSGDPWRYGNVQP